MTSGTIPRQAVNVAINALVGLLLLSAIVAAAVGAMYLGGKAYMDQHATEQEKALAAIQHLDGPELAAAFIDFGYETRSWTDLDGQTIAVVPFSVRRAVCTVVEREIASCSWLVTANPRSQAYGTDIPETGASSD